MTGTGGRAGWRLTVAVLGCALAATSAFAADDQGSQGPGLVKRALAAFLRDDEAGAVRGPHLGPLVGSVEVVSAGAGLAPMLHFWAPDIGGTRLALHASAAYSMYGYQYYDAQVGLVPHVGRRLPPVTRGTNAPFPISDLERTAVAPGFDVYASARVRDFPREDFYGLGAGSSQIDRTDYRLKDGLYEGIVRFRVARVSLMGRAGLLQAAISPGTDGAFPGTELSNAEETAPGLLRSSDFLVVSAGAWLELRDEPRNAHRGLAVGLSFSRFDDRHASAYQFDRTSLDLREYVALGSRRHVLALRQVTTLDRPDGGSNVPFYLQPSLGGGTILGSYGTARFRGGQLLGLGGEYRFELRPKVELALLYGTGRVFRAQDVLEPSGLRRSWGAGIRLKSPREVRLRLDVWHGPEGTRAQLGLGPSF